MAKSVKSVLSWKGVGGGKSRESALFKSTNREYNDFIHMLVVWLGISAKMSQNNAFTVAKRTLEGQDMIYQSLKLSNGIWALVGKRMFTYISSI